MKFIVLGLILFSQSLYAADAGFEARAGKAAAERVEAERKELNARLTRLTNSCTSAYYSDYGKVADVRSASNRRIEATGMRMDTAFGWTGLFGERPAGSERFSVNFSFVDPNGKSQKFTNCLFVITQGSDPRLNIKDCNYPEDYKGPKAFTCGYGTSTTRTDPCKRGYCYDRSVSGQVDKSSGAGKVAGPQAVGQ